MKATTEDLALGQVVGVRTIFDTYRTVKVTGWAMEDGEFVYDGTWLETGSSVWFRPSEVVAILTIAPEPGEQVNPAYHSEQDHWWLGAYDVDGAELVIPFFVDGRDFGEIVRREVRVLHGLDPVEAF